MQIDKLIQLLQVLSTEEPASPKATPAVAGGHAWKGRTVLVRSYASGVHIGELECFVGKDVVLKAAQRIWRWRGARTLNEIANGGIEPASTSNYTRVSDAVPEIALPDVCEVIPFASAEAAKKVREAGWAE